MEYLILSIAAILLFIISTVVAFYYMQDRILFKPDLLRHDYKFKFPLGLAFEEFNLSSPKDGLINGIHFKVEEPKARVFYFHGNSRSAQFWGEWCEMLAQRYQCEIILPDYRGYGKSRGKRDMNAMLKDMEVVYTHYSDTELPIVFHGRSLGGAFASHMASLHAPQRLILESTFTKTSHVVLPQKVNLPDLWLFKFHFQNLNKMKKIQSELFIIHGEKDRLIPMEQGIRLFKEFKGEDKHLEIIEGGTHNDLYLKPSYHTALSEAYTFDH